MFKINVLKAGAAVGAMLAATQASAASMLPVGAFTTISADAIDTVKDLVTQGVPFVAGLALTWFVVTAVKKLLSKGGVR